ncbi:hypothetical protein BD779DRAFT_1473206 [Infundibulicybe gibba]|nr:hypothetical protein BD779DRAFT_1473206 [Infundibulicybe gibba]
MNFLELPPEIIEQIILNLDPLDVSCLSRSARALYTLIYLAPTQALWRSMYLSQPLDDPRACVSELGVPREPQEIDWRSELQHIMRARTVCSDPAVSRPDEQVEVLRTLLDLVSRVPMLVPGADVAHNLMWALVVLRGGAFLDSPNEWVCDWVQMRALHHVVAMHVVGDALDPSGFQVVVFPMSLPFTQTAALGEREEDWAGYNATTALHAEPLDPSLFTAPDFEENFRSMDFTLSVLDATHTPPGSASAGPPPTQMAAPRCVGMCTLRATHISGGNSSEGVQVGGARSAFGVLGAWTTVFHDAGDPVGPFWMRKIE